MPSRDLAREAKKAGAILCADTKIPTFRQLTPQDYDRYDLLLAMEAYNIRNMMRILGGDPQGKVGLLLERDIADPWFTGDFETTWRDLQAGCQALLQRLTH